ncbi:MAG: tRNA (adenosine(37)-N6)-threonylcarbamoyltransferase complex ATPase subunit type 1 TsaE [Armatimonadota bacterium]|nr:tRNA (adenosine(37)-N6)-threonylcarbamoyltransferase complex ATPase subunit type 1 TsaE [Armatimonadota bacterium]MDR5698164.1 tRNA (adenosine(37)-N6)-threonylcarbamoyltransferase complex ATPase subunit type 1 TsaE [Armatimonadota bacterium]
MVWRRWVTDGPEQTRALGRALGRAVRAADVVALTGDLGAGKTTLVQGMAAGMGVRGYVASPTFTLIREYHGSLRLYHVDLYRLDPADLLSIGLDELFDEGGVVVIEWAERARDVLPVDSLWVEMQILEGDRRALNLRPVGVRSTELAQRWAADAHVHEPGRAASSEPFARRLAPGSG